jgi:hypothetical protein
VTAKSVLDDLGPFKKRLLPFAIGPPSRGGGGDSPKTSEAPFSESGPDDYASDFDVRAYLRDSSETVRRETLCPSSSVPTATDADPRRPTAVTSRASDSARGTGVPRPSSAESSGPQPSPASRATASAPRGAGISPVREVTAPAARGAASTSFREASPSPSGRDHTTEYPEKSHKLAVCDDGSRETTDYDDGSSKRDDDDSYEATACNDDVSYEAAACDDDSSKKGKVFFEFEGVEAMFIFKGTPDDIFVREDDVSTYPISFVRTDRLPCGWKLYEESEDVVSATIIFRWRHIWHETFLDQFKVALEKFTHTPLPPDFHMEDIELRWKRMEHGCTSKKIPWESPPKLKYFRKTIESASLRKRYADRVLLVYNVPSIVRDLKASHAPRRAAPGAHDRARRGPPPGRWRERDGSVRPGSVEAVMIGSSVRRDVTDLGPPETQDHWRRSRPAERRSRPPEREGPPPGRPEGRPVERGSRPVEREGPPLGRAYAPRRPESRPGRWVYPSSDRDRRVSGDRADFEARRSDAYTSRRDGSAAVRRPAARSGDYRTARHSGAHVTQDSHVEGRRSVGRRDLPRRGTHRLEFDRQPVRRRLPAESLPPRRIVPTEARGSSGRRKRRRVEGRLVRGGHSSVLSAPREMLTWLDHSSSLRRGIDRTVGRVISRMEASDVEKYAYAKRTCEKLDFQLMCFMETCARIIFE